MLELIKIKDQKDKTTEEEEKYPKSEAESSRQMSFETIEKSDKLSDLIYE